MADSIKIGNLDITLKVGDNSVSAAYLGSTLVYGGGTPPTPHDYSQDYLTLVATESGEFTWNGHTTYGTIGNRLSYSVDSGNTWSRPSSAFTVTGISSGSKILFRGSITPTSDGIGRFFSSGRFEAQGNVMSLLFSDNFSGQTDLTGYNYVFSTLFSDSTITSAENLILPATTLEKMCYQLMFDGCTNLTTPPQLPATTLKRACYAQMFQDCTSLTTAPELPSTTLADGCYSYMFNGCTSLTTAPELPAATLATNCYSSMFRGCTNLNSITCLATDISATRCTNNWVSGVAANGTFTKAASMSSWTTGASGIPSGWTVVDYTE
jgi:hypothetical protein